MSWTRRWAVPSLAGMAVAAAVYFAIGETVSYPESYFGVTVFLFAVCSLVVYPAAIEQLRSRHIGRLVTAPFAALAAYAFAIFLVFQPFFIGSGSVADRLVSDDSSVNHDFFKLMNVLFVVGFFTSLAFVMLVGLVWPSFAREFLGIEAPVRRRRVSKTAVPSDGPVGGPTTASPGYPEASG